MVPWFSGSPTPLPLEFDSGEEFNFSMTATFDVGTLAFSDLIVGTHIAPVDGSNEVWGTQTLIVTPEPASLAMMGLASMSFVGASWRRRRRRESNQANDRFRTSAT